MSTTSFQQTFPFTGMASQVDTFQHDGTTLVSHAVYTNNKIDLDTTANNQRRLLYVQSSTVQDYEVGGTANGHLITTTVANYTPDNFGNTTNVAKTVTDNDSGSLYVGEQWSTTTAVAISPDNSSNWCLTQPTQVTVTNSAPNVPNITRTVSAIPDYVHCRETEQIIEPSNNTYAVATTYGFDAFGNVNSVNVTGAHLAPRVTTTNWGTTGQFPQSVTNPLSQTTQYGYDFSQGVRTSAQDPNGVSTSWQYDSFGRRTRETRPDGTYTVWTYNDCATSGGCLIGSHALALLQTNYNADQTVRTDGTTFFDPLNRTLITNQRSLASGTYDRNEVRYDNFGRIAQRAMPCTWNGTTPCTYWSTNSYDPLGRVTQTQRPISATNNTLQTTTYQYAGRTTTITDPQGKQTVQVTTVAGTLGRSRDHNGYYLDFAYDAFGSLLSTADSLGHALSSATYDYGVQAFQRTTTDADRGTGSYTYDSLGEITAYTDAKSQNFSMTYDALSRPLTRTEPDLTTTWTWGSSAASFNIGRLQSVTAGSYAESYTYDNKGRPTNKTIAIPSDATYAYDLAYNSNTGLLDTLTYPVSTSGYRLKLQYAYQNGILSQISDFNAPSTVFWAANALNPRHQVTQETLGNGVVTNRTIDAVTGWTSAVTSGVNGGSTLQNDSYLFDEVGNLTQRQNNNAGLTENFYYDNLYRLDHSTLGGTTSLALTYDATGNITSRSDVAGGATWTYDPTRIHAVTQAGSSNFTYSYDANGNAMTRNGLTVTWTSYNHPSLINGAGGESVQFAYNQNHERWSAITNSSTGVETTYFIGSSLEKVVTAGSSDYRHYIYAGDTKVAIYSRTTGGTNTLHYVREDHLGSAEAILNSDGTSYAKESFTAFGARRSACTWSGPPTNGNLTKINAVSRRGFTWDWALGAMGLNDMNGRVQDAITGRFLSADPFGIQPESTQSFNRYSYVQNRPLSATDPTGFFLWWRPSRDDASDEFSGGGSDGGGQGDTSSGEVTVEADHTGGSQVVGDVPQSECHLNGCTTSTQVCSEGNCLTNTHWEANSNIGSTSNASGTISGGVGARSNDGTGRSRDGNGCGLCRLSQAPNPAKSKSSQADLPTVTIIGSHSSWQRISQWWHGFIESYKNLDSGLSERDILELQSFYAAATGTAIFIDSDGTVRVGRFMSPKELAAMRDSGRLVESENNGVTSVSLPANPGTYRAAPAGDVYVEFNVPASAIGAADGSTAKIYGPSSLQGTYQGVTEMPPVTRIVVPELP